MCQPEHIRLESLIGRGAFGVVYKGRLDILDTVVAVKIMALANNMDAMTLVRSASELAAMRQLRHHNVVQILAQFPDCVRPGRRLPLPPGSDGKLRRRGSMLRRVAPCCRLPSSAAAVKRARRRRC